MMITLLIAFAVGIVLGKVMLPVLHKLKFGQNIYELAPEAHKKKQGTPTMGGLVIAGAAIAAALVMNDYSVPMGQNMLLAMLLLARGVTWLLRTHYAVTFHGILGIVAASTLVIVPIRYDSVGEAVASLLCCAAGFLLAFFLEKLDRALPRA